MLKRRRRGFSAIEAIVSLTILMLVVSAVSATMVRHQRLHRSIPDLLALRAQLRYLSHLLQGELRGISAPGGDIYPGKMLDSAIEFRASIGETVVCKSGPIGSVVIIVPTADTLAAGHALSLWRAPPAPGDSVLVFDEGASLASHDDRWTARAIVAVSTATSGCLGGGLLAGSDASRPALQLTLGTPPPSAVIAGAPVRLYRRTHYSLYRSSDGAWYVGAYDCVPTRSPACATIQPVAGPLRSYAVAATGRGGLSLYYLDSTGVPTVDPRRVARIEVAVRALAAQAATIGGEGTRAGDSMRVNVGVRNVR